ncbi:hypothetical protein XINFAN_02309 [Pseudogemmobacter humi]|uniref:Uncharacterized protein n=1 Tax=Pseudogemmobacter humi TaxID=2483812 RepID=A0A3P5XDF9_9RHOB|nr:hypothetical protein XINFAN_02309 [Pseudogemmobacter humi]
MQTAEELFRCSPSGPGGSPWLLTVTGNRPGPAGSQRFVARLQRLRRVSGPTGRNGPDIIAKVARRGEEDRKTVPGEQDQPLIRASNAPIVFARRSDEMSPPGERSMARDFDRQDAGVQIRILSQALPNQWRSTRDHRRPSQATNSRAYRRPPARPSGGHKADLTAVTRAETRMHCANLSGQRPAAGDFDRRLAGRRRRVAVLTGYPRSSGDTAPPVLSAPGR